MIRNERDVEKPKELIFYKPIESFDAAYQVIYYARREKMFLGIMQRASTEDDVSRIIITPTQEQLRMTSDNPEQLEKLIKVLMDPRTMGVVVKDLTTEAPRPSQGKLDFRWPVT